MYTYSTNPKIKKEALAIAKKHILKSHKIYLMTIVGCLGFTFLVFLINLMKIGDIGIGLYFLASFGMALAPIVIGTITFVCFKKYAKRTYFKSEKEKITLYGNYMEYSFVTGDIETVYRIPYSGITSFHMTEGYELVILSRKVRVIYNNKSTLTKKIDDDVNLRRIEILYSFDNGDEMIERIREAVYPDKNEDKE